jgi:hypothetical protein
MASLGDQEPSRRKREQNSGDWSMKLHQPRTGDAVDLGAFASPICCSPGRLFAAPGEVVEGGYAVGFGPHADRARTGDMVIL